MVRSSSTSSSEDCEEPGGETSTSSDECNCVVCDTHDGRWIQCDVGDSWCHFKCANIPDNLSTESLDWQCPKCVC